MPWRDSVKSCQVFRPAPGSRWIKEDQIRFDVAQLGEMPNTEISVCNAVSSSIACRKRDRLRLEIKSKGSFRSLSDWQRKRADATVCINSDHRRGYSEVLPNNSDKLF
jgi:hypothetical protein